MDNDDKILQLKEEVRKKKAVLKKMNSNKTTKTNCSLAIDGKRYNINTLKGEALLFVLMILNSYRLSAKDLGISDFKFDGYTTSDWVSDLQSRVDVENYKNKLKEWESLESKLSTMLSSDKKTELELDSISDLLKSIS